MKLILNILFIGILLPLGMRGQDYDGVWRLIYEKRLDSRYGGEEDHYKHTNAIFDFREGDSSSSIDLQNNIYYYQKINDSIVIQFKSNGHLKGAINMEPVFKGMINNGYLHLNYFYGPNYYYPTLWKKLPSTSDSKLRSVENTYLRNSIFQIYTEGQSSFKGFKFHLIEDSACVLTLEQNNSQESYEAKAWIEDIGGTKILILTHQNPSGYYRFHLLKMKSDTILADIYTLNENEKLPPNLVKIKIVRKALPPRDSILGIKERLIGRWTSSYDALTLGFMGYDSITNITFEVHFKKSGKVKYYQYGQAFNEGASKFKEREMKGYWKVSPSGDFLILNFKNLMPLYVTLIDLKTNQVQLNVDLSAIVYWGYKETLTFKRDK